MPDIRVVQYADFPASAVTLDWLLTADGVLDETQELATAIIVALGTDARAGDTDILPNPDDDDRRGWWGDIEAREIWDGWELGSKLWLLAREKITGPSARQGSTLARAEAYVHAALQPFIARRICSRIDVAARRVERGRIEVMVTLFRGPEPAIALRFAQLWDGIQN